jgi:hypothetical protein
MIFRVILEGYKLYRVYIFVFQYADLGFPEDKISQYKGCIMIIAAVGILDEIILILIIVSTIMCVNNFGKGLKEMLLKQQLALNSSSVTQLSEMPENKI